MKITILKLYQQIYFFVSQFLDVKVTSAAQGYIKTNHTFKIVISVHITCHRITSKNLIHSSGTTQSTITVIESKTIKTAGTLETRNTHCNSWSSCTRSFRFSLTTCRLSSVQLKMVSLRSEKLIITRFTPSLRRFPNVAFESESRS